MATPAKRKRVVVKVSEYVPGLDDRREFEESITDPSCYEPLSVMVQKYMRGERKARFNPVYEVSGDIDPEKAISEMNPTRREGFDLADAASLAHEARSKILQASEVKRKEEPKDKGTGAPQVPASAGAVPAVPESKAAPLAAAAEN